MPEGLFGDVVPIELDLEPAPVLLYRHNLRDKCVNAEMALPPDQDFCEAARQNQAEVAVLLAQRDLERTVLTSAHAFRAKVAESQRWSPEAVQKFREAADLSDRHYRLGAVPLATYIELQNSYLAAVEALLDTKIEALKAGLKLQELTGLDFKPVEIAP